MYYGHLYVSLFVQADIDSGPTSPPKDTGVEEARAPLSLSSRKRRQRTPYLPQDPDTSFLLL